MLTPLFRGRFYGALSAFVFVAAGPARAAESIESVEKTAGEWARIRVESVRLETDWKARREMLESSLVALKERVRFLESRRDALVTKTAGDRQTLTELKEANTAAAKTMGEITARLDQLSASLIQLRLSLPPRLAEALELPYRSLAETSTSPGDKVQLIVKVLNRCTQFNKTVTLADEVLAPEAGADPRMLEVVYWGLSHGYALDRVNGKTYFGHPGEKTWVWEPLPDQAEKVSALIAIYKDKADPVFVEVPARVADFPVEPKL
jgi:Protein of unknown function (DUF3450)